MKKNLLFLLLSMWILPLHAQLWTQINDSLLEGKEMDSPSITIHQNKLYLLSGNSLYTSSDDGESWQYVYTNLNEFLQSQTFGFNTVIASNGSYLFTYRDNRILKSTNGEVWTQVNNDFYKPELLTSVDNRVYIRSSDSTDLNNPVFNIYFSDDGISWTKGDEILPDWQFIFSRKYPLAFHNLNTTLQYTYGGGDLQSIDSHLDYNGRPPFRLGKYVFRPDFSIDINDNFYYSKIDRYDIATNTTDNITSALDTIVAYGVADSVLFLKTNYNGNYKLLRSLDYGNTWTIIKTGLDAQNDFIPSYFGVVRSNLSSGPNLIAALGKGVYLSSDTGRTWVEYRDGLYNKQIVYSTGSVIFTGSIEGKLIKSTDGGTSWQVVLFPLIGQNYNFDNSVEKNLYTSSGGDIIVKLDGDNVYRSTDQGLSWTKLTIPYVEPDGTIYFSFVYSFSEVNSKVIMRIKRDSDQDNYLWSYLDFVSADGGITWNEITSHIPISFKDRYYPEGMFYESNGTHLFGVQFAEDESGDSLRISADNGITWQHYNLDSLLPDGFKFLEFENDGQDLYLTSINSIDNSFKLFKVTNTGALEDITGFEAPAPPYSVFKRIGSFLLAGNAIEFKSIVDGGHTWVDVNQNNLPYRILKTSMAAIDGLLFLGTEDGVWIGEDCISVLAITNIMSKEIGLEVFPNPTSEYFSVNYEKDQTGDLLHIVVYDLRGSEVKRFAPGFDNANYSVADLQKGLYTVNFVFQKSRATEKIILR